MALMDGELTEKEKQVLFKKAELMGVDLDEFEMVLDARLFEKRQSVKTAAPSVAAPKSDKFGDVKKCPACGAIVASFMTKCSDCSHDFNNLQANVSIQKLFEMLNEVESNRKIKEDSGIFGSLSKKISETYGGTYDELSKRKVEIIKNFPIPTTKNDILEFLSMAYPNAKKTGSFWNHNEPEVKAHNEMVPVWKNKCEQIIMKAKFSMKDDKKTLDEIMVYAHELGIK